MFVKERKEGESPERVTHILSLHWLIPQLTRNQQWRGPQGTVRPALQAHARPTLPLVPDSLPLPTHSSEVAFQ